MGYTFVLVRDHCRVIEKAISQIQRQKNSCKIWEGSAEAKIQIKTLHVGSK